MTEQDLKNLDVGFSNAVYSLIEALGMHWENIFRQQKGEGIAFGEEEFNKLLQRSGCGWNDVLGRWGQ
jgi:hypothetical protein